MGRKRTSGASHNKNAKTYDNNTQSIRNFFKLPQPEEQENDEDQQVILYDKLMAFFLESSTIFENLLLIFGVKICFLLFLRKLCSL